MLTTALCLFDPSGKGKWVSGAKWMVCCAMVENLNEGVCEVFNVSAG